MKTHMKSLNLNQCINLHAVPPPNTQEMAEERLKQGYECVDWYLCMKKL